MFLVFRLVCAGYCVFAATQLFVVAESPDHSLLAYLTVWTYLLLTCYFVTSALVTSYRFCKGRTRRRTADDTPNFVNQKQLNGVNSFGISNVSYDEEYKSGQYANATTNGHAGSAVSIPMRPQIDYELAPWYMKIVWLNGSVVYVFSLVVTVVYFGALYPAIGHTNYVDVNMHGVNSFLMLLDAFMVARPVRLLHAIYPVLYGACYLVFSAIYWSVDKQKNVLYPNVLDWNHPGITAGVTSVLTFVVIPLLQLLHYGIYRLRLVMYKAIYKTDFNG